MLYKSLLPMGLFMLYTTSARQGVKESVAIYRFNGGGVCTIGQISQKQTKLGNLPCCGQLDLPVQRFDVQWKRGLFMNCMHVGKRTHCAPGEL